LLVENEKLFQDLTAFLSAFNMEKICFILSKVKTIENNWYYKYLSLLYVGINYKKNFILYLPKNASHFLHSFFYALVVLKKSTHLK
jgi:hypothetical protein